MGIYKIQKVSLILVGVSKSPREADKIKIPYFQRLMILG